MPTSDDDLMRTLLGEPKAKAKSKKSKTKKADAKDAKTKNATVRNPSPSEDKPRDELGRFVSPTRSDGDSRSWSDAVKAGEALEAKSVPDQVREVFGNTQEAKAYATEAESYFGMAPLGDGLGGKIAQGLANAAVGAIPGVGLVNSVSGLLGGPTVGGALRSLIDPAQPKAAASSIPAQNIPASTGTPRNAPATAPAPSTPIPSPAATAPAFPATAPLPPERPIAPPMAQAPAPAMTPAAYASSGIPAPQASTYGTAPPAAPAPTVMEQLAGLPPAFGIGTNEPIYGFGELIGGHPAMLEGPQPAAAPVSSPDTARAITAGEFGDRFHGDRLGIDFAAGDLPSAPSDQAFAASAATTPMGEFQGWDAGLEAPDAPPAPMSAATFNGITEGLEPGAVSLGWQDTGNVIDFGITPQPTGYWGSGLAPLDNPVAEALAQAPMGGYTPPAPANENVPNPVTTALDPERYDPAIGHPAPPERPAPPMSTEVAAQMQPFGGQNFQSTVGPYDKVYDRQDVYDMSKMVRAEVENLATRISLQDNIPIEQAREIAAPHVVDVMTNRDAMGFMGAKNISQVMEQNKQFSPVNGTKTVKDLPQPSFWGPVVESHLSARAMGMPSAYPQADHYANERISDRAAQRSWQSRFDRVDHLGYGKQQHTVFDDPTRAVPEYDISLSYVTPDMQEAWDQRETFPEMGPTGFGLGFDPAPANDNFGWDVDLGQADYGATGVDYSGGFDTNVDTGQGWDFSGNGSFDLGGWTGPDSFADVSSYDPGFTGSSGADSSFDPSGFDTNVDAGGWDFGGGGFDVGGWSGGGYESPADTPANDNQSDADREAAREADAQSQRDAEAAAAAASGAYDSDSYY